MKQKVPESEVKEKLQENNYLNGREHTSVHSNNDTKNSSIEMWLLDEGDLKSLPPKFQLNCCRMTTKKTPVQLNQQNISDFLNKFDYFLLDCDGVLWRGKEVIPYVPQTLDFLRSLGKKLIFVTNNSTKSRLDYKKTIEDYGIRVDKEEIFSSSFAVAKYLQSINFQKKVYVVGELGIGKELNEVGIRWCGGEDHARIPQNLTELQTLQLDPEIGAVIAGLDTKLTYYKLCYALLHLQQGKDKCLFIASNMDSTFPAANNLLLPGGGVMVEALVVASGRRPDVVCGKPEPFFLDLILNTCQIDRSRTVMIGDRLETDIAFGIHGNISTLLVLTGVSTKEDVDSLHQSICPNFITNSISDIWTLTINN